MTCPVAAITYRISGVTYFTMGSANPGVISAASPHGPTTSAYLLGVRYYVNPGGSITSRTATTIGTGAGSNSAIAINALGHCVYEGIVTFSASGTFTIQAAEQTASADFFAEIGSRCDLMPVT